MTPKLDLDAFLRHGLPRRNEGQTLNAWVRAAGFKELYVRLTGRCFPVGFVEPVLDLANLTVRKPGRGTFTSLIEHLRKDYPKLTLYVENVFEPRFQRKLVRLGFTEVPSEWSFLPKSYVLLAVQR